MPRSLEIEKRVVKIRVRVQVGDSLLSASDDPLFLGIRGEDGREFRLLLHDVDALRRGGEDVFVLGGPNDPETNVAHPEINDPNRPLGVFLFCGPTGVGKTELARALARMLFGHRHLADGDRDLLVHLDMSEYAGFDAVNRLLGTQGGEPSKLIRRLRQQPFCVLLLDEIEKAAPEVFDVLLGVCDEGRLTDHFGRMTTFRSSIIIMTSNLGAERREPFGLGRQPAPFQDAVREFFRPEFFNRLDDVVSFRSLDAATIEAITRKELAAIGQREGIRHVALELSWSDRLVAWLASTGFDARYGARPLQRVLEPSGRLGVDDTLDHQTL